MIGASSITDQAALSQTVIERLQHLEAIQIATSDNSDDYLSITTDSSIPTLHINVVPIEYAGETSTGLVDVANAKGYIDEQVAAATTEVEEGKGIKVTSVNDTDGHTVYTIDSSLTLQYNASGNDGANITLTGANGGVFGTVNVSDIIGNGILKASSYDEQTGILTLTFATASGTDTTVNVDLAEMLDINDMSVVQASQKYLTVDLSGGENSQAQFTVHTVDVSTVTDQTTALADAWEVKQYVDSKVSDKNVSATGDNYVNASATNNAVTVETQVASLDATAGTAGTYDANGAQQTAPTAGILSGTANKLADAADIASKVKTYVDGAIAIEVARSDAKNLADIAALDSSAEATGTNVYIKVEELDGKLTSATVTESYATITNTDNTFNVTSGDESKMVKASDLVSLKNYVDAKNTSLGVTAQGDNYVNAAVDPTDNKKINVSTNVAEMTFVQGTNNADSTLTGVQNKLVDNAEAATKVTSFVNARISEEINKLDATANVIDGSSYINVSIGEVDGLLDSTASSISVTYGSFTETTPTNGIATREGVQNFVDTYDFWETYSAN